MMQLSKCGFMDAYLYSHLAKHTVLIKDQAVHSWQPDLYLHWLQRHLVVKGSLMYCLFI